MICETDESCQYIVHVEKECLVSTKSFLYAVADLPLYICVYTGVYMCILVHK